jgi:hypothetical protein
MVRVRSGCLRTLAFAAATLILPGWAAAQNVTGTISGTIVDEQGQVVPGATITVTNEATLDSRVVTSGDSGDFQVTTLPRGTYTVRVEMANFRPVERMRNVLTAAERLSVGTLTLSVGAVGETVTVAATGTRVNPEETQHSGLITSRQIEQIQVKGRDVTSLMRLVPGVRYEDTVESLGESFGTLIPTVGGQRRDWNTVMVDGVLGNEIGQANRMAQQINLDAVAEIKILLNTYRAEYGRTGGAQVQIISKSGGTDYAGNVYYYGRRERFNANNFFNNRADRDKPRYRFNTFGFNLGGPLPGVNKVQKKSSFFYSLEAPLTERPGALLSWTMPTERERRGDFSQTFDNAGRLIVIRDPNSGQPFRDNIIPPERINPNGKALLDLLPVPTIFDRNFTAGQFNHQTQAIADNPFDTGHTFANALLGSFREYTEIDAFPEVQARRFLAEWYLQDTWKASRRVTIDYGARFLYYNPWYSTLETAVFVPERYDPASAPRLYQPARINNQNVAFDPVTGQVRPNVFVGSFVPGTGGCPHFLYPFPPWTPHFSAAACGARSRFRSRPSTRTSRSTWRGCAPTCARSSPTRWLLSSRPAEPASCTR